MMTTSYYWAKRIKPSPHWPEEVITDEPFIVQLYTGITSTMFEYGEVGSEESIPEDEL